MKLGWPLQCNQGLTDCKAENAEGIISSDFQLIIINEPSRIESFEYIDPKMEVQEKSELELVCPYENFLEHVVTF